MFRSKRREVIVPQSEHARLAAAFALLWGNGPIAPPAGLPLDSFVKGVAFHDRGFGDLDTIPIGEAPDDEWLPIERRGALEMSAHDTVADIVVCRHIQRLVSLRVSEPRKALASDIGRRLSSLLADCGIPAETFDAADRITAACDLIAFDFSFEAARERTVDVPSRRPGELVTLTVGVTEGAEIPLRPWPLSVSSLDGYIIGYEKDGYPERLSPVIIPYSARDSGQ